MDVRVIIARLLRPFGLSFVLRVECEDDRTVRSRYLISRRAC